MLAALLRSCSSSSVVASWGSSSLSGRLAREGTAEGKARRAGKATEALGRQAATAESSVGLAQDFVRQAAMQSWCRGS
jgi:hypothetical protein